jgi:hypothetical protein
MSIRRALPVVTLLALVITTAYAQNAARVKRAEKEEAERKNPKLAEPDDDATGRDKTTLPALKVYEWGVATMNWDGSDEGADDVPAFYYDAGEVPFEQAPAERPQPEPLPQPQPEPKPVKIRKPVLYFACDRDVTFDLDVKFTNGKLTWLYPKPNRLTDAATVQWDNVHLYSDAVERDKFALPSLPEVDANHWAHFSREGSASSLVVNGEHERFLFYEGASLGLPDADIFKNADGNIVIHNYTAHEMLDVRVCLEVDGALRQWLIPSVPSASGEKPGEMVLADGMTGARTLAEETRAAGLTESQAKVFERAWKEDFAKIGTMSWRRMQAALDELMELKLTLPAGISSEVKRVGYVLVNNVDLTRQVEMDALVAKVIEGDADAETKLKASGTAGAGALRRTAAADQPLKVRLKLAKILGEMSATK